MKTKFIKMIVSLFSKDYLNEEASYELNKIVEMENKLDRKYSIYKTGNKKKDKTYNFQRFKTRRSLFITMMYHCIWTTNKIKRWCWYFSTIYKTKRISWKIKKELTLKNAIILLNGRQKFLNVFESGIFQIRKQEKGLTSISDCVARVAEVSNNKQPKILNPAQMLQRLPIALAQVKAGNTSSNLLNEIRQIRYYFYRAKEITKKYTTM